MPRRFAFLLCFFFAAQVKAQQSVAVDEKAVDAIAEESLKFWHAPGCAIAVIHEGKVVYLKGHGVRELGKSEPVTPDTVFSCGSLTKAFTATAIGLLVADGKMSWDDPVRKHVPYFRLADPLADREVTLRDLLCHRTGLARHDVLWTYAPWSLEEIVRKMAHLQPQHSFRSTYEYNNLTYITLGFAIEAAAGTPWDSFVRKRLLDPLGMKAAVFSRSDALKAADHAMPHRLAGPDKVVLIEWYNDDKQVRASGSLKTSARDLCAWVRLQLAEGEWEGKQLVARKELLETRRPQMAMPVPPTVAEATETALMSYGLGWRIRDYRGQFVVEHGGAVSGFRAHLLLAPKQHLGIVVLTNLHGADLPPAVCYGILDHAIGLKKKDWNAFHASELSRVQAADRKREEEFLAKRQPGTKPSRELQAYAGEYTHPAYGNLRVRHEADALQIAWSSFTTPLKHFHFDTFISQPVEGLAGQRVVFTLGPDGTPMRVRFLAQDFERRP